MTATTVAHDLDALLACPRCDRALAPAADGWHCAGCRMGFPRLGSLPWLFAEPTTTLGEWRGRLHFLLQRLELERQHYAAARASDGLRDATRKRLALQEHAAQDHAKRLRELLAPLDLEPRNASYDTHLALRTRLPPDQGITTYSANVHRDWCWGDTENDASFAILAPALAATPPQRVLVLGTGAGRIAYDIHARTNSAITVALDFNPLLLLVADRMARGKELELYEFPLAPRSSGDFAVLRRLRAPAASRPGLEFVLGDAHRPPFAAGSFDVVVTPWLVDILPESFDVQCARVSTLLADGGRWLNFGSLSFHDPDPGARYSLEECVAALEDAGFGAVDTSEHEIPYLCSPASRHARRETVVAWSATKQRSTKRPPRHHALPDWLVRGTEPVPATEAFRAQAAATRIHAFLMTLIDGRRSIKDMAKVCVEQRLLSEAEAEQALRSFLIKMFDDARRSQTF
jgi:SAM-dependent methyltransferase